MLIWGILHWHMFSHLKTHQSMSVIQITLLHFNFHCLTLHVCILWMGTNHVEAIQSFWLKRSEQLRFSQQWSQTCSHFAWIFLWHKAVGSSCDAVVGWTNIVKTAYCGHIIFFIKVNKEQKKCILIKGNDVMCCTTFRATIFNFVVLFKFVINIKYKLNIYGSYIYEDVSLFYPK